MEICSLASGSSGNCFLIKQNKEIFLIDAGISCRQIVSRMNKMGEKPESIKAIFITHGHSDHTKGAEVLSNYFKIPIYATSGTIKKRFFCSELGNMIRIKNNEIIRISGLEISAFSKSHDCLDPVSFKINCLKTKKTVSVITDIGKSNKSISNAIDEADFLAIESNYDVNMLQSGPYPYFLKKRISCDRGHFSNEKSALTVVENASKKLKKIILCHLSQINNTPELAIDIFMKFLKQRKDLNLELSVAPRYFPTKMFKV